MYGPYQCPLCKQGEETSLHLLDGCPFSVALWDHGAALFHRSSQIKQNLVGTLLHWPKNPFQSQILNRLWEIFPNFLMWAIWNERNTRIFHSKTSSLFNVWPLCEVQIVGNHFSD